MSTAATITRAPDDAGRTCKPHGGHASRESHPAAVEAMWREFAAPVRGFLRRRVASDADADDLLQEVFLRVHRQLPTLRDPP